MICLNNAQNWPSATGSMGMDKHAQALKILKKLPLADGVKITDVDATLLANGLTTAGTFVPVNPAKFQHELEKFISKAEKSGAPHYILVELRKMALNYKLVNRQNNSDFGTKIQLVQTCRQIWHSKTGKEAPASYRNDTHKFTQFVDSVINLHRLDFSARAAIEADRYSSEIYKKRLSLRKMGE